MPHRPHRPLGGWALAGAWLAALPAAAQIPPGQALSPPPQERAADPRGQGPAAAALASARSALQAGAPQQAVLHARNALALHPWSPAALRVLAEASPQDGGARFLWAHRLWLATANHRGLASLDRAGRELLPEPELERVRSLSRLRAEAAAELADLVAGLAPPAGPEPGAPLVARWALDLLWELGEASPALLRHHATALAPVRERFAADPARVVEALEEVMQAAAPEDQGEARAAWEELAMEAARALAGLAAQASFRGLRGPPPPSLEGVGARAAAARERLGQQAGRRAGEPLTVEQLLAMDAQERLAFGRRHATWTNPGRAVSPTGLYTVETPCGFESLLGAARTVELHHRRLVSYFGRDPFRDHPGTVRIVAAFADLEAEGARFWWSPGFQSGDLTVLRHSWSGLEAMGRLLIHELTHRFDRRLYPFLPAWLMEGKAVWTSLAWASLQDEEMVARHLDPRQVVEAHRNGYGQEERLARLLAGTIEEYRDNYTAGYALFVFLSTWHPSGQPLFAAPLERFQRNARAGGANPVAFFTSHFADGRDGRPKGLGAFAQAFAAFLAGCEAHQSEDEVDWIGYYAVAGRPRPERALLEDDPLLGWQALREPPSLGQDHAARAGRVLARAGHHEAAARALVWSLDADGWRPEHTALLAQALEAAGQAEAAWVARDRLRRTAPPAFAGAGAPSAPAPVLAALPRLRAFLEGLEAEAGELAAQGAPVAAAALAEERRRLGEAVGLPGATPALGPDPGGIPHPPWAPAMDLGVRGWTEERLAGLEAPWTPGLWFLEDEATLHVGRSRPREGTGLLDRGAPLRAIHVRGGLWMAAGDYEVRLRVHPTTSNISGAVVLGFQRPDRHVLLRFSARGLHRAPPPAREGERLHFLRLSLEGRLERERRLPGLRSQVRHGLPHPAPWFDLVVRATGPMVRVSVGDREVLVWTTPDLAPVEGYVGVAMEAGAVRLRDVRVRRLEGCPSGQGDELPALDPARPGSMDFEALLHRPVREVPLGPRGTLCVWIPPGRTPREDARAAIGALEGQRTLLAGEADFPQQWALLVPPELPDWAREALGREAGALAPGRTTVLPHAWEAGEGMDPWEREEPWVLFVDSMGILRAAGPVPRRGGLPAAVREWALFYRPPPGG